MNFTQLTWEQLHPLRYDEPLCNLSKWKGIIENLIRDGTSVGVSASFSEASARTVVANRYSRKHAVKGAK